MLDEIISSTKSDMEKAIEALKKALATIRTGRAHVSLLDSVRVDYYGAISPLSQIANITIPDPKLLVVKPWDKGMTKAIEKAIIEANLGLNASTDGDIVRVPVPSLTEERRKEFVKQARGRAEDAKVAVRNSRRDANEMMKDATKDGTIAEDDEKQGLKQVQELTDLFIRDIDKVVEHKEAEIMTV
jgi:ribosome recycling factor